MPVSGFEDILLLFARVLFGGVIIFNGINHFLDTEAMAGYAEYKGLPAPTLSVLGSGVLLVAGGASIALGVFPAIGALGIAVFLIVSAIAMHDFWAVPEENQQDELTHFLKNIALAGGALAIAAIASGKWAYSLEALL